MIPTLVSPKGGRPLRSFDNLVIDRETDVCGYKVGYLPKDCRAGEPVVIPLRMRKELVDILGFSDEGPKLSFKERLARKWLNQAQDTSNCDVMAKKSHRLPSGEWVQV